MKVTNFKRIAPEQFEADDQRVAEQLAVSLNPFMEQVSNAFNKNIDFDNLNQQIVQFEITTDANGIPTMQLEVKFDMKTRPRGAQVIRADSLSSTSVFPTSTPFITFDFNNGNLRIRHVSGLPAGRKFQLTVILIG